MLFGLFGSTRVADAGSDIHSSQNYKDVVDFSIEAEALGYHSSFFVEHHFTGQGQVSATLNLLTWLAARTTTLRVGTAVMVLPWHNPVLLAEQVATVDLLSGGRIDFGVGKGYRNNEFAGFCIPMEEAEARFEESLSVMRQAWSGKHFTHHGRFWDFDNVVVEPPVVQKPSPPVWMGAGSEASIRRVAQHGANLMLDHLSSAEEVGRRIAIFKSEVEACGRVFDPMTVAVARAFTVTRSAEEKEAAIVSRMAAHKTSRTLAQRPDGNNKASFMSYADTRQTSEESALFGSVDEIVTKVEALRDAGVRYILVNPGSSRDTLRALSREVFPAFAPVAPPPARMQEALQPAE